MNLLLLFGASCLLCVGLASCDYYDHRLRVVNRSAAPIFVEVFESPVPDFSEMNGTAYYQEHFIRPDSSAAQMWNEPGGWPVYVRRSRNRQLNLGVFQAADLQRTPAIDSLIRRRQYTLRSFSESALDSMGWTVVYPW